jgi:hypothetical protein
VIERIKSDLHIHTALSPCASDEMTPHNIGRMASVCGIRLIAVTDHNSGRNCRAVAEACRDTSVAVLPGMELQTREDIHLVCYFPTFDACDSATLRVCSSLPAVGPETRLGRRGALFGAMDSVIGEESRFLLASSDLSIEDAVDFVHGLGGLCICAHIDRASFSIIGQLGFIPPGLKADAVEKARGSQGLTHKGYTAISASDAHCLEDMVRGGSELMIDAETLRGGSAAEILRELSKALAGSEGRMVL